MKARTRPLIVRPGARYACFGDGVCCTDAHVLGPVARDEASRVRSVLPSSTTWHGGLRMTALAVVGGRCAFLGPDGCELHATRGAAFKPSICRRFPYGLVATAAGGRITTEHRCPCRTLGERPPIAIDDASRSLTGSAGRIQTSFRVEGRIPLEPRRHVSFEAYERLETELFARIARGDVDGALDAEPFVPLEGATWNDVAHHYRAFIDGSACGEALAWFGDALLAVGGEPKRSRARPWRGSFDRAEARSPSEIPAEEVLADWVADAMWDLSWIARGSFAHLRRDLATRLDVARWITRRLASEGARPDRAAAEALLVVELAGEAPLWPAVVRSFRLGSPA